MHRNRQTVICLSKLIPILAMILISFFIIQMIILEHAKSKMILDKVVILSRHNVRTPISKNVYKMTPNSLPQWEEKPGYLTKRGFLLEGFMGKFFSQWLESEKIVSGCPLKDMFVYANNMERTLSSAKSFLQSAYPNCNIPIHHTHLNESDPIFGPYIHNSTGIFKELAIKEMKSILSTLNLNSSYLKMEELLNYEQSILCIDEKLCDMTTDKINFDIIVGKKPVVSGPLKLCNEAIDLFLMEYYNGLPLENVAWGELKNVTDWLNILKITAGYHNVAYNGSYVARDIAMPLFKYLRDVLLNKHYKVTLLMGHDANINVLMNLLSFKQYNLNESYVNTPIGGKIVFEKWLDVASNKYLLKINYVYQSNRQLREAIALSLKNPPQFNLLELNGCRVDERGFCSWDDFVTFLNTI